MQTSQKNEAVVFFSAVEIGGFLKSKRQELGLSIEEISSKIKIKSDLIEVIEKGDFSKFPGRIYSIGFVRSYASYLGLDADFIVYSLKLCPDFLVPETGMLTKTTVVNEEESSKKMSVAFSVILLSLFVFLTSYILKHRSVSVDTVVPKEQNQEEPMKVVQAEIAEQ